MTPERVPPFSPERPIRPLPKRMLREKLSPEAIRTIQYPRATMYRIPLDVHPPGYPIPNIRLPLSDLSKTLGESEKLANGAPSSVESFYLHAREPFAIASSMARQPRQEHTKYKLPLDPGTTSGQNISAASSMDGYDSLENTNNKKKRKIPSAADTLLRGGVFSNNSSVDMLEQGSGTDDGSKSAAHGPAVPKSPSTHNDGISGSGRGRLSRVVPSRTPLMTLSDGNNTWPSRSMKTELYHLGTSHGTSGIISNAIANAERLAPSGQENAGSLLRQHADSEKTTPIASQFTFTCGLQVASTASWPDTLTAMNGFAESPQSEHLDKSRYALTDAPSDNKATKEGRGRSRANGRQLERDIVLAARDRRQAAVDSYHHNPPRPEDVWICEFCEYERIFGSPPKALIREYEMKDRRSRQEEADRRRLLDKAKAKSRKGRKGSKAVKGTQPATQDLNHGPEDHAVAEAAPMEPGHCHSARSEVDYEDRVDGHRPQDPPDIPELLANGSVPEGVPID